MDTADGAPGWPPSPTPVPAGAASGPKGASAWPGRGEERTRLSRVEAGSAAAEAGAAPVALSLAEEVWTTSSRRLFAARLRDPRRPALCGADGPIRALFLCPARGRRPARSGASLLLWPGDSSPLHAGYVHGPCVCAGGGLWLFVSDGARCVRTRRSRPACGRGCVGLPAVRWAFLWSRGASVREARPGVASRQGRGDGSTRPLPRGGAYRGADGSLSPTGRVGSSRVGEATGDDAAERPAQGHPGPVSPVSGRTCRTLPNNRSYWNYLIH